MTASVSPPLVEPAYKSHPEFTETLGPEVSDLAELAGFAPDPEQRLALDLIFALDNRGKSAAFEMGLICSRQNLKTGTFKQAALGWMFILELPLVVWSAHEFRTAQEAFRDMEILISGSRWLESRVKKVHRAAGSEGIELRGGQRLMFKARTKSGGRGLTGDRIVLDEAFALQPDHMGALLPTLSVVPDPQVIYGSSAGLMSSEVLRGIRDRGRPGTSHRLAYLEWAAPVGGCHEQNCDHRLGREGCALDDEDNWARANPLLGRTRSNGTGLTVEHIRSEREAMPPMEFARERLGWWDESETAAAFGPGKWEARYQAEPEDAEVGAIAVAVSIDLATSAVVHASRDADGIAHMKPRQHGPGTDWVVDRAVELHRRYSVPVVIDGHGPGADLIPKLRLAGVEPLVTSTPDVLDACAGIFKAVQDGTVAHGGYPELDAAVGGAVKREVGDRWAWGRKKSTSDITPLEAGTLAVWALGQGGSPMVWGWPDDD